MDFNTSETRLNLMRAFAGESQARNRYTIAAEQAKSQKLYIVSYLFQYTADQEKTHAKVFYEFLKDLAGTTIKIDGGYPVDINPDISKLLRMAQHNEFEENDDVYPAFAEIARKEGFDIIANKFTAIAKIEKIHGERFGKFAELIEQDKLFDSGDNETEWICLKCGHVHKGPKAPKTCPICGYEQGHYIRKDMAPFFICQK